CCGCDVHQASGKDAESGDDAGFAPGCGRGRRACRDPERSSAPERPQEMLRRQHDRACLVQMKLPQVGLAKFTVQGRHGYDDTSTRLNQTMKAKQIGRKPAVRAKKSPLGEEHLQRVRRICATLPERTEKISHGEPTFFTKKKVY